MSNNSFDISGDLVRIHTADGMFHAVASIRDDYRDELMSVTWGTENTFTMQNWDTCIDILWKSGIQRKFLIL